MDNLPMTDRATAMFMVCLADLRDMFREVVVPPLTRVLLTMLRLLRFLADGRVSILMLAEDLRDPRFRRRFFKF